MTDTLSDMLEFPHGLEVDLDEGWPKIIARQFGGDPGRGFCELIQNAIDSYPPAMEWADRLVAITTSPRGLIITDWGEGLSRERLQHLTTLGGTDKAGDASRIGQFGIGFFAIFNPALGTRRVTVTTCCEGHVVRLRFEVTDPAQRPALHLELLAEPTDYSTRVEVELPAAAVHSCVAAARKTLHYYPCGATVDGEPCRSVWEPGPEDLRFGEGPCSGLIRPARGGWGPYASVLAQFEHLLDATLARLAAANHPATDDLRDLKWRGVPYVPDTQVIVNHNQLGVPISRDGFYLDQAFEDLVKATATALRRYLLARLRRLTRQDLPDWIEVIIANQYLLAAEIRQYLTAPAAGEPNPLVALLAAAPVYALANCREPVSLLDLQRRRTPAWPVWFAPHRSHLGWAGGAFQRDFIVLPPRCAAGGGAPDLYPHLFGTVFGDAVDLDTLPGDPGRIAALVERGLVDRAVLSPTVRALDAGAVGPDHRALLAEVNGLLARESVRAAVVRNLCLPVGALQASFFELELAASENLEVATGLLDEQGELLRTKGGDREAWDLRIGLHAEHPLIERLAASRHPYRAYYALTYIAHELARAQQRLVPDTPAFYFVRDRLSQDLRQGLLETLVPPEPA